MSFPKNSIKDVIAGESTHALVTCDCLASLRDFPNHSIDCVITSPPYFNQREYEYSKSYKRQAIGGEKTIDEYVHKIKTIFSEVKRILKPCGSLWLNIGDKFIGKELAGIPWRVALALKDDGWILRQDIIWNQLKGTQSAKDRMRDIYEHVFHFVKRKNYYFRGDSIRIKPNAAVRRNGKITSASGVTGKKYYKQIRESKTLSEDEKVVAQQALENTLAEMERGEIVDFRMTIKGVQRTYHSQSEKISGRAKELQDRGYYILKMKSNGYLPSNIWEIVPEDRWRKDSHCAVFPEELLRIPLLSTCPENGIVLDPFSGTGTTVAASLKHGCRGIGLDISSTYNKIAYKRIQEETQCLALLV